MNIFFELEFYVYNFMFIYRAVIYVMVFFRCCCCCCVFGVFCRFFLLLLRVHRFDSHTYFCFWNFHWSSSMRITNTVWYLCVCESFEINFGNLNSESVCAKWFSRPISNVWPTHTHISSNIFCIWVERKNKIKPEILNELTIYLDIIKLIFPKKKVQQPDDGINPNSNPIENAK